MVGASVGCLPGAGGDDGDSPPVLEECATGTGPAPEGAWDTDFESWYDPGAPGNDSVQDACGVPQIVAHHCFSTPVHAVHMRTGEIMVMHGQSDQRVWPIGEPASTIDWHPVPYDDERPAGNAGVADLFCSGHSQLADGRVLFAGGNIDGSPGAGGIRDSFRFDPFGAAAAASLEDGILCPFGWELDPVPGSAGLWANPSGRMAYDRWYPTLTTLPNGMVLIAGGTSRRQTNGPLCDENADCDGGEICHERYAICQPLGDACDHSDPEVAPCDEGLSCHEPSDTCQPAPAEANLTRVLELYDPSQPAVLAVTQLDALFPDENGVPEYPFMFVLPNGDVLYAGSDAIRSATQANGQILVMDYGDPQASYWGHTIGSTIGGGSAVMFEPGHVLKSGGRHIAQVNTPSAEQTNVSEVVDLRGFPSGVYDGDPANDIPPAPTEFSLADEMGSPRHFHTLTVLPDGRVLATGGSEFGNSESNDHYANPCRVNGQAVESRSCAQGCASACINWAPDVSNAGSCVAPDDDFACSLLRNIDCTDNAECDLLIPGATCDAGRCNRPCTQQQALDVELCGYVDDCGPGNIFESPRSPGMCGALNHACYATRNAEIWDPQCNGWTEFAPERFERMYHSTALLLPDTRVISMGNGHRDFGRWANHREGVEPQYFAPQYAANPAAVAPAARLPELGLTTDPDEPPPNYLPWGGTLDIVVDNGVQPSGASLVRLGSVTHGFDMDQRWVPLATIGTSSPFRVAADESAALDPNTAPPGWYMLFVLSDEGEPSEGIYIRLGPDDDQAYACQASELLTVLEHACAAEPHTGVCDPGDEVAVERELPTVELGGSSVPGFRVLVPAGTIEDHGSLTSDEQGRLEALCAAACEQHVAGLPAVTTNCRGVDVFAAIEPVAGVAERPLELLRLDHRHGEDLFPPAQLGCDLADECHAAFDEQLAALGPRRASPASDALGRGVEWTLAIAGEMEASSSHAVGQASSAITGEIAYSLCTAGNASGPCPFYLGALELELREPLTLAMTCDGVTQSHTLSSLSLSLAQPAFGVAEEATAWRAFPPGALVIEAQGVLDGVPFVSRRPNQEPLYLRADDGWSMLQGVDGAWLAFGVPCGDELAEVLVWWGYGTIAIDGEPPFGEITVPASVPCPSMVALTASLGDDDGDFAGKQWFVDGVRIDHDTTQIEFTSAHQLRLVTRDARGATTTDVETVNCE